MSEKSEVEPYLKSFTQWLKSNFKQQIGILHTDKALNILMRFLVIFLDTWVFNIILFASILLDKTGLPKEKTNIY